MRRVVVTGLGAITPVGNDIPTMWEAIKNGECGIDLITKFDTADYKAKVAAEVKNFDPTLYMEKRDVRKTDLYCQYAIAAATQAVEDSKIVGTIEPERFGVYVGAGIGGMTTFVENTLALDKQGPRRVSPHFIPMLISNIAAGTIAIKYNAKGVSLPIVSACATGTNSIGEAFHAIKNGYADAIITGGAEATITPLAVAGFTNCKALSTTDDPKKASIPFDKNRNGFVMGEGSGIMVLEEYEHAVQRGAKIYAEICGYGNTNDAHHVTAPDPTAEGPARSIKLAFEEAQVTADDIIYINTHGTSTPMNDKTETKAIKLALGEERASQINISSTKSMTGHMLGAAGGVEGVISALSVQNGIIPPTIGYSEPDEECDLNCTPNTAVEKNITIAASTSLGFGGHNACIVFRKV